MNVLRAVIILPALACATLAVAGCGGAARKAPAVIVEHEVSPQPPKVGPATFTLSLADAASSKPLSGARVELEGDMTHAGMTPVFAEAKEVEPGRYRATLDFTMGGDWVVLVRASLPDGRKVERQLDVRNVRAE